MIFEEGLEYVFWDESCFSFFEAFEYSFIEPSLDSLDIDLTDFGYFGCRIAFLG